VERITAGNEREIMEVRKQILLDTVGACVE
jgi:hypothetical protein